MYKAWDGQGRYINAILSYTKPSSRIVETFSSTLNPRFLYNISADEVLSTYRGIFSALQGSIAQRTNIAPAPRRSCAGWVAKYVRPGSNNKPIILEKPTCGLLAAASWFASHRSYKKSSYGSYRHFQEFFSRPLQAFSSGPQVYQV